MRQTVISVWICAGATTFLAPQFAAAGPFAYQAGPTGAVPGQMQLTPAAIPSNAVQPVNGVNAVVPVCLPPPIYAAPPPPAARPPATAPTTAFAATAAAYQPIIYWYPSPPVSPQTAPYYVQTTVPTTVLMKGLPPNIQIHDVLSFLDGLVEVCTPLNVSSSIGIHPSIYLKSGNKAHRKCTSGHQTDCPSI